MLQKSKTIANLAMSFSNERRHTRKAFALIRRKICKFTVGRKKVASSCNEYIMPSAVGGRHITRRCEPIFILIPTGIAEPSG